VDLIYKSLLHLRGFHSRPVSTAAVEVS